MMDMKEKTTFLLGALCLLLTAALGLMLLKGCEGKDNSGQVTSIAVEKKVEVEYDTIPFYYPVPKDSVVLRYATTRLPTSHEPGDTVMLTHKRDSVSVEIPITRKEYGDSTYRAWVSGYMAQLDSIEVYGRRERVTETITRTVTEKERRRWGFSVGPTVGAGWNGNGFSPYVGIGLTWGVRF